METLLEPRLQGLGDVPSDTGRPTLVLQHEFARSPSDFTHLQENWFQKEDKGAGRLQEFNSWLLAQRRRCVVVVAHHQVHVLEHLTGVKLRVAEYRKFSLDGSDTWRDADL